MANRRLKFIVLLSRTVVDPGPARRRDAAHTSLTIRKPSSLGLGVGACVRGKVVRIALIAGETPNNTQVVSVLTDD